MLTESHKFVTAHFTNSERTTIEIEWQDPESDAIEIEYIEMNEEDASYQYLLNFVELDTIHDNTKIRIKDQRETYLATVKYIAEQENLIYTGDSESIFKKFNDFLFDNTNSENTEFLFKIKLIAFELPFVKDCKDRDVKSKLRKASSILDVYKVLIDIKLLEGDDVSTGSEDSESN